MARVGAALSQHPVTATAVGEATGEVLEALAGAPADLAVLFVTPHHAGALEDAAAAVRAILSPATLLGCSAVAVAGQGVEVEDGPGVSVWAGALGCAMAPVRLQPVRSMSDDPIAGWPEVLPFDPAALVLLGDPFSSPADAVLDRLAERQPGLPVIGGMASAARGPGGNRLALDGRVVSDGAVGALLGPGCGLETVVSQGCRPIGDPFVVTRAEGEVIYELAGRPPLERLTEIATTQLHQHEVAALNRGLHLGIVVDEHRETFGPGDFLVRNVLGADRANGAIAVGDVVPVGTTVQFHLRDADAADIDLRALLADTGQVDGALLFTCNGRGRRLFGVDNHDAELLAEATYGAPAAGFFAAGELGPIRGRNALHGFTASIALFRPHSLAGARSVQPSG